MTDVSGFDVKVESTNKPCIFILGRLLMVRIKKLVGSTNDAGSTSLSKVSDSVTIMLICVCVMFAVTTTPYATLYNVNADVTTVSPFFLFLLLLPLVSASSQPLTLHLTDAQIY